MMNIENPDLVPRRATMYSAGYDIFATERITVQPYFTSHDSGVCFDGSEVVESPYFNADRKIMEKAQWNQWVALVLPRSSFGFKHGLRFANTVCVIDKDYRDTIKLSMCANHSFNIEKGERYAQMIFLPYGTLADEIMPKEIRSGGIGSTGN